jgi:predicted transcriptional regulator
MGKMGKGRISPIWTVDMDHKLLSLVKEGKRMATISNTMKMCKELINRRLRELGLGTLKNARYKLIITREFDKELLSLVGNGRKASELATHFNITNDAIFKRLKEMGFDGLKDARRVMNL